MKKRKIIYDFIRVFSCICVIGIHSTDNLLLESISRIGLPMFVFLSGILILNSSEEKINQFYFKRFVKIVVPLYLYSFFYLFVYKYNYGLNIFIPSNFMLELVNITKGYVHYHLWYVYMIIGIYLCAPYLKKMCKSLTNDDCKNLLILIFLITLIKYTLPNLKINIGISSITFIDWSLMFLLGYLTTKECINKNYKLIYYLGLIAFCFSIFARNYIPQLTNLNDISITMMLQLMSVYIFFYRNKKKICCNKKINKIIEHISKYTFDIYLIHVFLLDKIKTYLTNLNTSSIANSLFIILLVTISSYLSALIIRNMIINPIQKLTIKITNIFKRTNHESY